ncbi:MAG TPA: FecR family protein [Thermoanaerobaculia bacterium]|nr:FecR family protein [Thermoanaerobaculia bacterium]
MSESEKTGAPDEDVVRRLLEEAGPRPSLPQDDLAAITQAARGAWSQRYGRKASARPERWWVGLAAAAALAIALGLVWWSAWWSRTSEPPLPASPIASIEVLTGAVRMRGAAGESPEPLPPGALGRPLPAGSELETGEGVGGAGRLALRMAGGPSVRLDAGTRVRLVAANLIELDRGAVYVDSGAEPGRGEMAVRTPAGLFQDVGTQFEVRIEQRGAEAVTRLRVREGRVDLERGGGTVTTGAGEELIVRGDGQLVRQPAAVYGPEWSWVLGTTPMLDIEGLKAREFLDWIARENGWRLDYADEQAASLSGSTVLHGSIDHLTLAEAPGVVLASCGLGHRVSSGRLIVFVADDAQ